jgi:maltose alpha-D-glucosyltransferase/alpha-amylase
MEEVWFRNAVFYSLDVETFYDSNGDGKGDFQGLLQKMDFIAGLGVDCIWLLPFYPSPNHDNGYDVMNYYNVEEQLGNLGDFAAVMNKAEQLGLRIIIDLVVNHTSIEHPWFQEARKDRNSPYRNYYIWADEPMAYTQEHLMFEGEEDTIWTHDEEAGQYYLHRFYKEQPDLNINNPVVKEEILKIMGFWLRLGVHGFRIDAAEMIVEPYGLRGTQKEDLFHFFNEMREFVRWHRRDALLLAEVNDGPDEMMPFFEKGDRVHMLFNFFMNQHLFLSFAEGNKTAVEKALKAHPPLTGATQWLQFLRQHDELNLRQLSKQKQNKVFEAFGPEEDMQVFGFGIRRRLASMMNGEKRRLQLAYSLLFSMPGAHMLRYGDEIGMGEDLSLKGRSSVRTPMQWSPQRNGGFSTAPEQTVLNPVISGGKFGYEKVNVLTAQQDPASLLNWIERLITIRKQCPEIGYGELYIKPYADKRVLVHGFEWKHRKLLFLHNLSNEEVTVLRKKLSLAGDQFFNVFGDETVKENEETIIMKPYAYKWLRTE